MFGSANPGCQMVDVIYQSVINQTNVIFKDNKAVAVSPDYYPKYAQEYIRYFSLDDKGFDEFSYDLDSFIGNGSILYPERLAFLGNELKVKGPSFFAVKKNLVLKANGTSTVVTTTGLVGNQYNLVASIDKVLTPNYKQELKDIVASFEKYSSFLKVNSGNITYDAYVNNNLPFQVMYQTYVSRAFAQTQKGYREIGFREIEAYAPVALQRILHIRNFIFKLYMLKLFFHLFYNF